MKKNYQRIELIKLLINVTGKKIISEYRERNYPVTKPECYHYANLTYVYYSKIAKHKSYKNFFSKLTEKKIMLL